MSLQAPKFRGRFGPGRLHSELWAWGVKPGQKIGFWDYVNLDEMFFVRFDHVDNPCRLSGRHNLESETITQKLWIYSCIMVVINQAYSKSFWEIKDENDYISFILCRELETIECCTRWQKDWEYGFEWNTTQASRNNFMTLKHDFTVKLLLRTDFYVQLTNWL